ncbi:hypothetical protein [Niabella drilacis]|nr:hypothetical protein [Niabella drilacis]
MTPQDLKKIAPNLMDDTCDEETAAENSVYNEGPAGLQDHPAGVPSR